MVLLAGDTSVQLFLPLKVEQGGWPEMGVLEKKDVIAYEFWAFMEKFAHGYLPSAWSPPPSAGCANGGRPQA